MREHFYWTGPKLKFLGANEDVKQMSRSGLLSSILRDPEARVSLFSRKDLTTLEAKELLEAAFIAGEVKKTSETFRNSIEIYRRFGGGDERATLPLLELIRERFSRLERGEGGYAALPEVWLDCLVSFWEHLEARDVELAIRAVPGGVSKSPALITHPKASAETIRWAFLSLGSEQVALAVASVKRVHEDPEIKRGLMSAKSPKVAAAMLPSIPKPERMGLWRRWAEDKQAISLLYEVDRSEVLEEIKDFESTELEAFLQHPDRAVRVRASSLF